MKKKISVISLGCPRNLVDTESLLSRLKLKNYNIVDIDAIDSQGTVLVNTCAFIKEAKQESIDIILDLIKLKKEGRLKKIIIYGCLPERYKRSLIKHFKEIDAFCGKISLNEDDVSSYRLTPSHYAYVKISEGCINHCSYCVIPKIKGPLKSRSIESIMKEVKRLDSLGAKEIILVGQDISAYGVDLKKRSSLTALIRNITKKLSYIKWVRLLYLNPSRMNDDLIDEIANNKYICKYVDLPIQHINNKILRLMNRRIKKEEIISLIEKMRNKIPGVSLRTSLIVGFPGEGAREFDELVDFVRFVKFSRLGAFMYSREEDTPAYDFKKQVPFATKKSRLDTIMVVQREISAVENKSLLNKKIEVLIDERIEDNIYLARSQADAPEVDGSIYVKSKKILWPGDFVKVNIIDTQEYDLVGEVT